MKKFSCLLALLLVLLVLPGQAWAAAKIDLAFDGVLVPTERTEENTTPFYLEARPQMRSNTVFVPVRVVSEIMGAEVRWQEPEISIKLADTDIKLTLGSRTAVKNGQEMKLPAAPYERGGYTYVPIRFVAEAFDCDVEWQAKKNLVNIKTQPWELDGQLVVGIANEVQMTARNYIYACQSPYWGKKIYQILSDNATLEVSEPGLYGANINMDPPYYYFEKYCFYFLKDDSSFLNAWENWELTECYVCEVKDYIKAIRIYTLLHNSYDDSELDGYNQYLLEMDGKWYALSDEFLEELEAWYVLGDWQIAASSDQPD